MGEFTFLHCTSVHYSTQTLRGLSVAAVAILVIVFAVAPHAIGEVRWCTVDSVPLNVPDGFPLLVTRLSFSSSTNGSGGILFATNSSEAIRSFLLVLDFFDDGGHLFSVPVFNNHAPKLLNPGAIPERWLNAHSTDLHSREKGEKAVSFYFRGPLMTVQCPVKASLTYAQLIFETGEQFSYVGPELILDPLIVHAVGVKSRSSPALIVGELSGSPHAVHLNVNPDQEQTFAPMLISGLEAADLSPETVSNIPTTVSFVIFVSDPSHAIPKLRDWIRERRTVEALEFRSLRHVGKPTEEQQIVPTTASSAVDAPKLRR